MRYVLCLTLLLGFASSPCAQFLCVDVDEAPLKSAPSEWSYALLEVPRNYPLTVQGEEGPYREVSDYRGRRGWMRKSALHTGLCVVVAGNTVNVRAGAGTNREVVARAQEGVAFQVLDVAGDWLQVRHETGREAWIHGGLVWGPR